MQRQLRIWKRFIISLSAVDICSLSWESGRGLLDVYQWWTDAASAGDLEEVYYKFIRGGRKQPQLGIWKRFIRTKFPNHSSLLRTTFTILTIYYNSYGIGFVNIIPNGISASFISPIQMKGHTFLS